MAPGLTCSAPGKLVLLGEYAVLFGHPAVVAAVNRRARVGLRPAGGPDWELRAPGYAEGPSAFRLAAHGAVRWTKPSSTETARWALLEQVLAWLPSTGVDPVALPPAALELDTRAFFHVGRTGAAKLGLGSSAALTAALASALCRWAGTTAPGLGALLGLHRRFQGGRGSGVDLAASLLGGVVEYRLSDDGAVAAAEPLELPPGLRLVVVWTGRSASTAAFLGRLDERLEERPVADAVAALGKAARDGVGHLRAGSVSAWLDDVTRFAGALDELGRAAGLEILSREHRELRRLAQAVGLRYKPSGAGGGDVGVAFTDDGAAASAFASAAAKDGYAVLDLAPDPIGLDCWAAGD